MITNNSQINLEEVITEAILRHKNYTGPDSLRDIQKNISWIWTCVKHLPNEKGNTGKGEEDREIQRYPGEYFIEMDICKACTK